MRRYKTRLDQARKVGPLLAVFGLVSVLYGIYIVMHSRAALAPAVVASATTLHYTVNVSSVVARAATDGYNVFDVAGSTSNPAGVATTVAALPAGSKALIWVGNLDNAPVGSSCPAPGFTQAQFQAQVDALAGNAKVYGYYISDEPHPSVCPTAASDIRSRADYIHAHTTQKAFIVVLDGTNLCPNGIGCEYQALAPANTHVDLVGLDPYPCHYDSSGGAVPCDNSQITSKVNTAIANGIPVSAIVPTFQTFGQEGRTDGKAVYYRTPTPAELSGMLSTWQALVPKPAMDYSYTYGVQCSSSCPAPQALSNHAELSSVMRSYNTPAVTPSPTPSPSPSPSPAPGVPGDLNQDGKVDIFDLSTLLSHWGTNDTASDINHDGTVSIFDLSIMLSHWTG